MLESVGTPRGAEGPGMKRRTKIAFLLTAIVAIVAWRMAANLREAGPVPVGEATPPPAGDGWIDLLDPEHAPGWKNVTDDKEIFEIEEGTLHIFGRTITPLRYVGYTTEDFGDFELHVEVKVSPGANSGIFLRTVPKDELRHGFEVQVLDDFGEAASLNGSGAVYDVVSPMHNMALPAGEWNSYDIRMVGQELRVVMNGWLAIDSDFSKMTGLLGKFEFPYSEMPEQGTLSFQDHGGEVWYRNVRLKSL